MKEGREPEYTEKTPDDGFQKSRSRSNRALRRDRTAALFDAFAHTHYIKLETGILQLGFYHHS